MFNVGDLVRWEGADANDGHAFEVEAYGIVVGIQETNVRVHWIAGTALDKWRAWGLTCFSVMNEQYLEKKG